MTPPSDAFEHESRSFSADGVDKVLGDGQARFARVRQRAGTAKAVRNARTLARFWQTQGRLTWQDAAICSLFAASMAGIAQLWS